MLKLYLNFSWIAKKSPLGYTLQNAMPASLSLPKSLQIGLGAGLGVILLGILVFGIFRTSETTAPTDSTQSKIETESSGTLVEVDSVELDSPTFAPVGDELAEDETDPDPETLSAEEVSLPANQEETDQTDSPESGVYVNEVFPSLRVPYPAGWTQTARRVANEDFPGLDNVVVEFRSTEAELTMTLEPTGLCGCGCGNGPLPTGYQITTLPNDIVEFRDGADVVYGQEVECAFGFFTPSTLPLETSPAFNEMITGARDVLSEAQASQVWFDARFEATYSSTEGLAQLRQIVGNLER